MTLLSGWKEIATYMRRGVRTVQRYEEQNFPIRRQLSGAVVAYAEEVDAWVEKTSHPVYKFKLVDLLAPLGIEQELENRRSDDEFEGQMV